MELKLRERLIEKKKRIERALNCENLDDFGISCNNLHCRFCADEKSIPKCGETCEGFMNWNLDGTPYCDKRCKETK